MTYPGTPDKAQAARLARHTPLPASFLGELTRIDNDCAQLRNTLCKQTHTYTHSLTWGRIRYDARARFL